MYSVARIEINLFTIYTANEWNRCHTEATSMLLCSHRLALRRTRQTALSLLIANISLCLQSLCGYWTAKRTFL